MERSWILFTAMLVFTLFLVAQGFSARRLTRRGKGFVDGDRRLGYWHVLFSITGMWASSMFVVELETGFLYGWSAVWFGLSVIAMSVFVATALVRPFQRAGYLTNSGLVGRRFGPSARRFAAAVIAATFPVFAMSNVLAAAAFLHVLLGVPLVWALCVTTLVVSLYVGLGGLWAVALTQFANLAAVTAGLLATVYTIARLPGTDFHPVPVQGFDSWTGVGLGTIAVWVAMNLVNSLSAQAELQTVASAKDPRKARLAVFASAVVLVFFAVVPVWIGMRVRGLFPFAHKGLEAFPLALAEHAPTWALTAATVGVWAGALCWAAPLLFSGAVSFGCDLFGEADPARKPSASLPPAARQDEWVSGRAGPRRDGRLSVVALTRWGLLIQGILVVLTAMMRPDQLAWWRVFGQTVRSGAIFAPTLAYFVWPSASRKAVVASMVAGVAGGAGWSAATGFSATRFLFSVNPMWVALAASLAVLVGVTLLDGAMEATLIPLRRKTSAALVVFALGLATAMAFLWGNVPLRAVFGGLAVTSALVAVMFGFERPLEPEGGDCESTAAGVL